MARAHLRIGLGIGLLLLVSLPAPVRAQSADDRALSAELSQIALVRIASFETPEGGRVTLVAGDYRLTLAEPGVLWVRPLGEGKAVQVAAASDRHQQGIERPVAVTGADAGEPLQLMLLLPGGAMYRASGLPAVEAVAKVSERGIGSLPLAAPQVATLAQAKVQLARTRVDASARFREYLADPTPSRSQSFRGSVGTGGNVMETLFLVFRQSIRDQNEDKKYYLQKLQQNNEVAEELSDYLESLVELSATLGSGEADGGCEPAADGAERAADSLLAAIARFQAQAPTPGAARTDLTELQKKVHRERIALSEMRALVRQASPPVREASPKPPPGTP